MQIQFTRQFAKQYRKSPKKIQLSFDKKLALFLSNPQDPPLNNHALTGRLYGYRSINVTGDWRAVFQVEEHESVILVRFVAIGTHSQLYR